MVAGKLHPRRIFDMGFTHTSGLVFQIPDVEGFSSGRVFPVPVDTPFSSALSLCDPYWIGPYSYERLP